MIPVRLRVRNFMSYGEDVTTLDFTTFRLACLCGENGHGKSALLDAITWALWGRARISDRRDASDDELIHLGKSEMEVEFEFALDGTHYVAIRRRTIRATAKRRTSTGMLEFQIVDGQTRRPLTGDSVHATQRKINEVLRLDYETFVNSAFILQGRADEFTRKTSTERKRILSDLLGLGYYDDLEEAARAEARRFESERREHETAIADIDRDLELEPRHREDVARLTSLLAELAARAEEENVEVARLRGLLSDLESRASYQAEILARVKRAEASGRALRAQLAQARARVQEHETLLAQSDEIRRRHAALFAARAEQITLDATFARLHALTQRKSEVEAAIARARAQLETEKRLAAAELAKLNKQIARLPELRQQETTLRAQLANQELLAAERDQQLREVESARAQADALTQANLRVKEEGVLLRDRLDLLAKAGATCPICETELDVAGARRLVARFTNERGRLAEEFQANQKKIAQVTAQGEKATERVGKIDEGLRQHQALVRGHAAVEKSLAEIEQASSELVDADTRHELVTRRLADADYAGPEQAALRDLVAQVRELGYDPRRHQSVRDECATLATSEVLFSRLETAEAGLPRERGELTELEQIESGSAAELALDHQRLGVLEKELAAKPEVEGQVARARQSLDDTSRQLGEARERRGEAQQRLNSCAYQRQERERKIAERDIAAYEKSLYDDLALAFGKKGIQAMLIEGAIPEIEREANEILGRMTDGRLTVKFETQRDSRSGDGTIETLDIKISDELGVRNLELYSGGEAFRVNFAIRIALSKLLVRRAGARVQTLVIDEGFGTQDSFGRQRLVEAINSVASDFDMIIVITHIDELKDSFPTRIDVVKGPEGSRLTVT